MPPGVGVFCATVVGAVVGVDVEPAGVVGVTVAVCPGGVVGVSVAVNVGVGVFVAVGVCVTAPVTSVVGVGVFPVRVKVKILQAAGVGVLFPVASDSSGLDKETF